ncbi:YifB family Mg chelatase-like AAA ATPase [Aeromonas diversa]|uniref:YifB family Mg chelatase-like AAA ATPase n=1 Tax=Aeromonas diversa TaxID=502790 RepID=UPI003462DDE5
MSLAVVYSRASLGVEAPLVTVEVHLSNGLPAFNIVGLPETSVKESRDRVRSALLNGNFEFPARRITVNLAPADLPKEGGRFDLAIALGILAASQQIPAKNLLDHEFLGELALTGELRPVLGVLPAVLACRAAGRTLVVACGNGEEAALIRDAKVRCAHQLLAVTAWLSGQLELPFPQPYEEPVAGEGPDLLDVIGQAQAKRALEIAAAGSHHLLFIGPPGTGKSMLASRLPGILPPLSEAEAQESAAIHSIGGQRRHSWHRRPFRTPHHSASAVALVGGGSDPRPGEISLAHNGVLFLDELPEFERKVLDNLREPLETGHITISRAARQVDFPARFQLVAAMNPSPCGHYGDGQTRSTPDQILRYLGRLSGPFLDRFDLTVEVPLLPKGSLSGTPERGESSAAVRERVWAARARMQARAGKLNQRLDSREIDEFCRLSQHDADFLEGAIQKLGLSIRAWHRILRVARTIADLAGDEAITRRHLVEALGYRAMDRFLLRLRNT